MRDMAIASVIILRILLEPALARRLRDAGLIDVQKYAWTEVRSRLLALYVPGTAMSNGTDAAAPTA